MFINITLFAAVKKFRKYPLNMQKILQFEQISSIILLLLLFYFRFQYGLYFNISLHLLFTDNIELYFIMID